MPPIDRIFGSIRCTEVDWPILVTELPETRLDEPSIRAMLAYFEERMSDTAKTHGKIFFVTDMSRVKDMPDAHQRQITAAWSKRNDALSRVATVGSAVVTPSSILRGIMTAIFWVAPPPRPVSWVATRREAILQGIEMLNAEKVSLPPRLIAYRDRG